MSRVDLGLSARGRNSVEETRDANLAAELLAEVRGEVRFGAGDRALYATDASNYRQLPIGVLIDLDLDDDVAALAVCREHQASVFGRGTGTSPAGQCCNAGVCFDFSKYCTSIVNLDHRPRQVETFFSYPDDDRDFSRAVGRCVGVGDCRRHEGTTMSPSYRVTGQEAGATRGRSRLLFEMLNGAELAGWRSMRVRKPRTISRPKTAASRSCCPPYAPPIHSPASARTGSAATSRSAGYRPLCPAPSRSPSTRAHPMKGVDTHDGPR